MYRVIRVPVKGSVTRIPGFKESLCVAMRSPLPGSKGLGWPHTLHVEKCTPRPHAILKILKAIILNCRMPTTRKSNL